MENHFTMREVAALAGVSLITVSIWKVGKGTPTGFPVPIKIGPMYFWPKEPIEEWLKGYTPRGRARGRRIAAEAAEQVVA